MKLNNIYAAMAVAASMLAASCTVSELATEDPSAIVYDDEIATVSAVLPGVGTKVSYSADDINNLINVSWEEGDAIYLSTGSTTWTVFNQAGAISEDGKFTNFNAAKTYPSSKYKFFSYPVQYTTSSGGTFQLNSQGGSLAGLKKYDYLTSFTTQEKSTKDIPELHFERQIAVLELAGITFPVQSGEVSKIYLSGPAIANRMLFSTSNNDSFGTAYYYRDKTITVTPDSTVTIDGGVLSATLYIAFFPMTTAAAGDECKVVFHMKDSTMYEKTWKASSAYQPGVAYKLTGAASVPVSSIINFEDPDVKTICVAYWDLDGDGELSEVEASLATGLNWAFNSRLTVDTFNEFQYFTGVTTFNGDNSGQSGGFAGCTNLKEITMPESLTLIGSDAFNGCTSLKSVTVPNSVKRINAGAFKNCTALESVTIPETVSYMGEGQVFSGCTSLKTVNWPDSTAEIPTQTFLNSALAEFVIPETVKSIGISAFSGCTSLTSINIPKSVQSIGNTAFSGCTGLTSIDLPSGVTTIGSKAFFGSGIRTVTMASSVTSIGAQAFNNCVNITSFTIESGSPYSVSDDVTVLVKDGTEAVGFFGNKSSIVFPSSVTAIGASFARGSEGLKNVSIPAVTTLGDYAFAECPVLETAEFASGATSAGKYTFYNDPLLSSVTLPSGITEIGVQLFSGCSSLKSVDIPSGVTAINSGAFTNCTALESVTLPSSLTKIVSSLFKGCTSLKTITIPDGVNTIQTSAFEGCTSLATLELPSSLTIIPISMVKGCTSLKAITIPSGVTSIGQSAFQDCTGLTSIELPSGLKEISASLLSGCTGITEITIPSAVTKLGASAFAETGIRTITIPSGVTVLETSLFKNCTKLESLDLPSGIKTVKNGLFEGCTALSSITLPSKITELPRDVFKGCTALETVTLPSSLTKINTYTFQNCSAMKEITIPASVTSIMAWAFTECSSLKYVVMEGSTPCTVSNSSFRTGPTTDSVSSVEAIYVPDDAIDTYKAASNWSKYWSGILYKISEK